MPHTNFILFDGPTRDEISEMAEKKLMSVDFKKYAPQANAWGDSLNGDISKHLEISQGLVRKKNMKTLAGVIFCRTSCKILNFCSMFD